MQKRLNVLRLGSGLRALNQQSARGHNPTADTNSPGHRSVSVQGCIFDQQKNGPTVSCSPIGSRLPATECTAQFAICADVEPARAK